MNTGLPAGMTSVGLQGSVAMPSALPGGIAQAAAYQQPLIPQPGSPLVLTAVPVVPGQAGPGGPGRGRGVTQFTAARPGVPPPAAPKVAVGSGGGETVAELHQYLVEHRAEIDWFKSHFTSQLSGLQNAQV